MAEEKLFTELIELSGEDVNAAADQVMIYDDSETDPTKKIKRIKLAGTREKGTNKFRGFYVDGAKEADTYWISGGKVWRTKSAFNSGALPVAGVWWELALDNAFVPITANQFGAHEAFPTQHSLNVYLLQKALGVAPTPQLTVSYTQTNVTNIGGSNGSITATGSGGTAPYQYNLNGGSYTTNNVFNNLPAGTHTLGVKDANNSIASKPVEITQPAAEQPPVNNPTAYYGWKATKASLTSAEIQAGTAVAHATGADITADYRANTQPQFLWFAEKASEPVKTKWHGSDDNNGNIGTDQDLFGSLVIVGEWRFYITEYMTQNNETTIQFRKA